MGPPHVDRSHGPRTVHVHFLYDQTVQNAVDRNRTVVSESEHDQVIYGLILYDRMALV